MQDGPKSLNYYQAGHVKCSRWRIETRAVGRQLDQMDTASCPCEEGSDIWPFVVGSVVPDDMNVALIGVARLDPGQKLDGTDPINGCGLDKRCIEGFEVQPHECPHDRALAC